MVEFQSTALWLVAFILPAVYVLADFARTVALGWIRTKFGFTIPEEVVAKALQDAIQYGVAYANNRIKEKNLVVKFDNEFVATAVEYIKASVPGAIKRFGFTDERLADMVRARL
jgi:hypothetical protein